MITKHIFLEPTLRRFALLILLAFFASQLPASVVSTPQQVKAEADSLYVKGEYRGAAAAYEKLADTVKAADVYYNLGNSYFRLNEYPEARLAFEKALLLSPADDDVKDNLSLTVSKIKTNDAKSQSFITVFAGNVCHAMGTGGWSATALLAFVLALALFLLFYFGSTVRIRKASFAVFVVSLCVMVLSFVCAGVQNYERSTPSEAIVLKTADVRRSPTQNAGVLKQLLAGTKVGLASGLDVDGWTQVSLGNGDKGWMKSTDVGIIGLR